MGIRLIHQWSHDKDLRFLDSYATSTRESGVAIESEVYVRIDGTSGGCLVELWESETTLVDHWAALEGETAGAVLSVGGSGTVTELYSHCYFDLQDGTTWTPVGSTPSSRLIHWPARDEVRVVAQGSVQDPEQIIPFLMKDMADTQREYGCVEYSWFRGSEHPEHQLLLELWQDQRLYDNHWALRGLTRQEGEGPMHAPRAHGTNGIEFYRRNRVELQYGRWLPADPQKWSTTISWPA